MNIEPTYWEAFAIVILLFLLVFTLARLRHMYVHWSFKTNWSMIFIGFMLALILEGFTIIGGKTLLIEIFGWNNAPKPISTALDMGRNKMIQVLGVNTQIPVSDAKSQPTYSTVYEDYQSLSTTEAAKLKEIICSP